MIFAREPLTAALLDESSALTAQHWDEIAAHKDIPLDVDVESYLNAEASGLVRCYTVRADIHRTRAVGGGQWVHQVGELTGYAIFFVRTNMHYRTSLQATQDVLYLHPSVRGTGDGLKFLAWCDEQLQAEGVQVVYHHAKPGHPALAAALISKLGYSLAESIYARRLDVPLLTFADLMAARDEAFAGEDGG